MNKPTLTIRPNEGYKSVFIRAHSKVPPIYLPDFLKDVAGLPSEDLEALLLILENYVEIVRK